MSDSCDPHVYHGVDAAHKDLLFAELSKGGYSVTGKYDVDTHNHGITLHGDYDEPSQTLTVSITNHPSIPFVDVCGKVWEAVDPAINKVLNTPIVKGDDPNAVLLGQIGANQAGSLSDADRATFKSSLDGLAKLDPNAPKTSDTGATPTADTSTPTASAAGASTGVVDWIKANPVPSAIVAAGVGYGLFRWMKK